MPTPPPKIKIRHIEVFRAVFASNSIRVASQNLHVSPPAVSASLKQLEQMIGLELFVRTSSGLFPTDAGLALNKRVRGLYEQLDDLGDYAVRLRRGAETTLRIASSPNLALKVIPTAMKELLNHFPECSLSVEVMPSRELVNTVEAQRADIGVGIDLPVGSRLVANTIGICRVVAAIPSSWPESSYPVIGPTNLASRPWIRFHPETTQGAATQRWFEGLEYPPSPVASVRVARVACSLVEQQIGFALLDEFTAEYTNTAAIKCVPIRPAVNYSINVLRASEPNSNQVADAFLDHLQRIFRDQDIKPPFESLTVPE
jgi:DNA-binding transcriptional LysR family regulator